MYSLLTLSNSISCEVVIATPATPALILTQLSQKISMDAFLKYCNRSTVHFQPAWRGKSGIAHRRAASPRERTARGTLRKRV